MQTKRLYELLLAYKNLKESKKEKAKLDGILDKIKDLDNKVDKSELSTILQSLEQLQGEIAQNIENRISEVSNTVEGITKTHARKTEDVEAKLLREINSSVAQTQEKLINLVDEKTNSVSTLTDTAKALQLSVANIMSTLQKLNVELNKKIEDGLASKKDVFVTAGQNVSVKVEETSKVRNYIVSTKQGVTIVGGGGIARHTADGEYVNIGGDVMTGNLSLPSLTFDTAYTLTGLEPIGTMYWNDTDGTVDLKLDANTTMQIGQELPVKVYNDTGADLEDGKPVYVSGRQGHVPKVAYARSDVEATARVYGVVTGTITDKSYGYVTLIGQVRQIKTNYTGTGDWGTTWAVNDLLYVSKTVAGQLTNVEPTAPHHSDIVAQVSVVGGIGTGAIDTNITRHKTLEELTDVDGADPTLLGDMITFKPITNVWERGVYNITEYPRVAPKTPTDPQDIGAFESRADFGYGEAYITNKKINNSSLGYYDTRANVEGGLRYDFTNLNGQIYTKGEWKNIRALTDAEVQDIPLWSDFEEVDGYGIKVIHGHSKDIGAFSSINLLSGGTF